MASVNHVKRLGLAAMALLILPWDLGAQVASGHVAVPTGPGQQSLSAAIREIRRSPFHLANQDTPADTRVPSAQTASNDSTLSHRRVFLAALGSSALTIFPGLVLSYGGASSRSEYTGPLILAGLAIPVFGTAAGVKLAGARFRPALAGSALGLGAGIVALVALGGIVDPNDNLVLFAIPATVQAAVTTLIVSRLN